MFLKKYFFVLFALFSPLVFSCSTLEKARRILEKIEEIEFEDESTQGAQEAYVKAADNAIGLVERIITMTRIIAESMQYAQHLESGPESPLSLAHDSLLRLKARFSDIADPIISADGTFIATLPATEDVSVTTDLPKLKSPLTTYVKRCIEEYGKATT